MAARKKTATKTARKRAAGAASSKTKARAATRAPRAGARPRSPKRAQPETLRLQEASPSLTVDDIDRSLAFYRDVLGFTVKERWEEKGKLLGLILLAGSVEFFLSQDDWKKGKDRRKGEGFRLYVTTVQDVDVLARDVRSRGAALDQEPTDHEWGRDFSLADPDGFRITILNETKKR